MAGFGQAAQRRGDLRQAIAGVNQCGEQQPSSGCVVGGQYKVTRKVDPVAVLDGWLICNMSGCRFALERSSSKKRASCTVPIDCRAASMAVWLAARASMMAKGRVLGRTGLKRLEQAEGGGHSDSFGSCDGRKCVFYVR